MTAQHDWSKLPKGWKHHKSEMYGDEHITDPSGKTYNVATWMYYEHCRDALRACRIPEPPPPPDTATVTALRPADEYDWSRLEGSGWSYKNNGLEPYITNGAWDYWLSTGGLSAANLPPDPAESALKAHQEAYSLVAKCKRDWRDEVKQACEGLVPLLSWYLDPVPHAIIAWEGNNGCSRVRMRSNRTWETVVHTDSTETVLTMSLIIERLKKLGWREEIAKRDELEFRTDPYAPLDKLYFMRASEVPA